MSPRTVTTASPSDGVVADCNSGAIATSLPWSSWPASTKSADPGTAARIAPQRLLDGDRSHVGGLGASLALGDVELDGLAVLQRATVLDGAGVDEDVVAGLGP